MARRRRSQGRIRRGKERKEKDKEDDKFSVCSDWDVDLEDQDRKNQELDDQKNKNRKIPQTGPNSSSVDTLHMSPPNSLFVYSSKIIPTKYVLNLNLKYHIFKYNTYLSSLDIILCVIII